jgi:trans-aconitate 2-methyltransferase
MTSGGIVHTMREWNAETYHRVSDPQYEWGLPVLDRLALRGDERVVDVGCGTGRLTERLLERLPRGEVIAADLSFNMLQSAREYLAPRFARQVRFAQADAAALPFAGQADAVFSTATFHWVLDHPMLFKSLHAALKPGGRLVAQCGGVRNIQRVHDRCAALASEAAFAPYFAGWTGPWHFADPQETVDRLVQAGFTDACAELESKPFVPADADAFREFVSSVVCRHHLSRLPDAASQEQFMDALTAKAVQDNPPFELDYWRLNIDARKP